MPGPGGAPYVNVDQLGMYCPAATLNLATLDERTQACLDATQDADDYMNGRYQMPLLDWPSSIQQFTAYVAIYKLLTGPIGMAPQAGSDVNFEDNYCRAMGGKDSRGHEWTGFFPDIQAQRRHPAVTPSLAAGSDPLHDAPQVQSQPKRGWQQINRRGKPVVGGF